MKKIPVSIKNEVWDWQYCSSRSHPQKVAFLIENYDKPITEDEYVSFNLNREHTKKLKPSARKKRIRKEYRNLKSYWGFFREKKELL